MASVILPANPSESRPGRFGVYGGRYVPETLMAALVELEHEYEEAKADAAFQAELTSLLDRLRRPAHAALLCQAAHRIAGRGKDLPQARRPAAHRRAQDQQRARPGTAGQAHGQEARHRRDRRGPARRGHGDRLRAARPRVRHLHGRCGHGAPGAERDAHAAAGRGGARRLVRLEDAQRRHQRGHARLGHQRPHHLLPARQRARRASLSDHGARLSSLHQQRDEAADSRKRRPAARRRSLPASAADRTPSARFTSSFPTARCGSSASKPAAAAPRSASTRRASRAARPACCRAPSLTCCRMRTARSRSRIRSPRVSITPPSAPSTRCCTTPAAPSTSRCDDASRARRGGEAGAHRRHSAGARKRARRGRGHAHCSVAPGA